MTVTVRGTVTEEAPFASNTIAGARVEFIDGVNAGKFSTTDASGAYAIFGAAMGGYTMRASAVGYSPVSVPVTLNTLTTQGFALPHPSTGLHTTFGGGYYRVNIDIPRGRCSARRSTTATSNGKAPEAR
jgi:hypothetical protein